MQASQLHLLRQLKLPDRFESLSEVLGAQVAQVLVNPDIGSSQALQTAALSVRSRREGLFIPVYGESGAGKTTLASSLTTFFPTDFSPSVQHTGPVTYQALHDTAAKAKEKLPANDGRIIPINNDHREGSPPSKAELAEIKRFLRAPSIGARALVFWPETDRATADEIAENYVKIAGDASISLPLVVDGPSPAIWQSVVENTLELANNVHSLTALGIDPGSYDPAQFDTLGKFMRKISTDFDNNVQRLISSTQVPVSLVIVFASESGDSGVLEKLCNSSRLGLLDASALIAATPSSVIGKWWTMRRGLLVQTILRLNAHAFALGPSASITALRQHGAQEIRQDLISMSLTAPGPKLLHQTLARSDFGKFLVNNLASSTEDRGTPSNTSTAAFQLVAERGFTYGADKSLNKAMAESWASYLTTAQVEYSKVDAEKGLGFCALCPDNSIFLCESGNVKDVVCVEYTWRKGEFLGSKNKATAAAYILEKLKNYARELQWTVE